jgi:hypothetical protein
MFRARWWHKRWLAFLLRVSLALRGVRIFVAWFAALRSSVEKLLVFGRVTVEKLQSASLS